jgi:hypothetical protein
MRDSTQLPDLPPLFDGLHKVRVQVLGGSHTEILFKTREPKAYPLECSPFPTRRSQEEIDEENRQRAANRAKKTVRHKVKCMALDTMLTLTYRENQTNEELCKAHLKEFVRRVKSVVGAFHYVAAYEVQKRGAWHVHLAVRRVQSHFIVKGVMVKSYDLLRSIWRSVTAENGGNVDVSKRKRSSNKTIGQIASYLSKYMVKGVCAVGDYKKRFTASRCHIDKPFFREYRGTFMQVFAQVVQDYASNSSQKLVTHLMRDFMEGTSLFIQVEAPAGFLEVPF